MKKILLLTAFALISYVGYSQELGARFGDVVGNHVAIDAMFSTGKFNRVHADVSFGNSGVGVEVLWDFLYRPFKVESEAFNWYVGVGPSTRIDSPFWLGFSGEVGIEYRFTGVPIALGLDYRPTFWIIDETDFSGGGFGFNARWIFGQKK